jgi:hypothetical protein
VKRLAVITAPLLALCSMLAACGSKGSVAVSAGIDSPTVAVTAASPLAANLSGGFTLYLELGAYAPSGTDVTPRQGNFSLVKPSDQASLLVLHLTSATAPPFHLEPAGKARIAFTIDDQGTTPGQQVTVQEKDAICQSRTVQIAGSVSDSASGNPTPVTSSSFDVTGCQ